jgi:hypothetical protein
VSSSTLTLFFSSSLFQQLFDRPSILVVLQQNRDFGGTIFLFPAYEQYEIGEQLAVFIPMATVGEKKKPGEH